MKKTVLVTVCLILLTAFRGVFAQDETAPQSQAKMITAIEVKGNKSVSANAVISKIKMRIGAPYQENVVSDDLKRLYLLGFFSDIKIDTEDYNKGVKVIINVTERPVIEKITFTGINHITMREERLKDTLKSKETQYLDYPNLAEDVQALRKLYEKSGYNQVKIDYKVDTNQDTNKARIQFNVMEGKKIRIKNILVEGNKAYPDRRILRLLKTKRAWTFNRGILKEEVLKEDIERVIAFYRKGGYSDVTAGYEIEPLAKRPSWLIITVKIEEGKKYLFGNVNIQGNKDIPAKDILAKLEESVPGKIFSQDALKKDVVNIQGLYFDRGYIFAQIQEATSLNSYTGRIDVVYNIIENEVAYVDKIKIKGNVKTKDVVIRRELRIKPGDRFDGEKLKRSKERLQNLGYFEELDYSTEDSPSASNKRDLVVEVREAKTGAFSFGGGYSSIDQFVGFAEIEQKNFDWKNFPYFTGDGQDLRLRASFGSLSEGFDLSFTEPWVFDYPVSFGFDLYRRTHDRESDIGYGYDEDISGGNLRLGKEISEFVSGNLMYRYNSIDITDITEEATDDLKKEYGKNIISSVQTGLAFDNRDSIQNPKKGDILSGSLECAGGPFGGDKDFVKFFARASHYIPLVSNSALELRARAGFADAYGDSDDLPIYERFFAGGAYTVRGYHERKLGPVDPVSKDPLGGNSLLVGNIEYIYPVFDFLNLAAFYDVGNVWKKMSDFGSDDLKKSTGLGLRIKTPIGPLMLDYGIPFDKEPGEEKKGSGRFHFNMSHGF
ncbi:MAG: outer membrane protein assembly factor BamA [Candidatus Omnitrophica bacterium]|nr:outer membrane protein assembly factor BamA [Candidatus Omnitrophota bacterium]